MPAGSPASWRRSRGRDGVGTTAGHRNLGSERVSKCRRLSQSLNQSANTVEGSIHTLSSFANNFPLGQANKPMSRVVLRADSQERRRRAHRVSGDTCTARHPPIFSTATRSTRSHTELPLLEWLRADRSSRGGPREDGRHGNEEGAKTGCQQLTQAYKPPVDSTRCMGARPGRAGARQETAGRGYRRPG